MYFILHCCIKSCLNSWSDSCVAFFIVYVALSVYNVGFLYLRVLPKLCKNWHMTQGIARQKQKNTKHTHTRWKANKQNISSTKDVLVRLIGPCKRPLRLFEKRVFILSSQCHYIVIVCMVGAFTLHLIIDRNLFYNQPGTCSQGFAFFIDVRIYIELVTVWLRS